MKEWLTTAEAAKALGVSARTLLTYQKKGLLKTSKDARDARRTLFLGADVAKVKAGVPAEVR